MDCLGADQGAVARAVLRSGYDDDDDGTRAGWRGAVRYRLSRKRRVRRRYSKVKPGHIAGPRNVS